MPPFAPYRRLPPTISLLSWGPPGRRPAPTSPISLVPSILRQSLSHSRSHTTLTLLKGPAGPSAVHPPLGCVRCAPVAWTGRRGLRREEPFSSPPISSACCRRATGDVDLDLAACWLSQTQCFSYLFGWLWGVLFNSCIMSHSIHETWSSQVSQSSETNTKITWNLSTQHLDKSDSQDVCWIGMTPDVPCG